MFCLFSLKHQLCCSTVLDPGKWQKLGILGACVQQEQPPLILSLPLFLPTSQEGSREHVSLHLNLPSPIPSQNPPFSLTCCFLSSTPPD